MIRTILAVLALVGSGVLFFGYTKPLYDDVHVREVKIAEHDQALTRAAELQKLKQTLLSRYNAFDPADLERLHKMLPDHVDNVRLVLDLDSLATKHHMAVENVVVNTQKEKKDTQTIGGTSSNQKYDSLTLRFATDGTYQDFIQFIEELESSLRIVDVVNVALTQGAQKSGIEPIYHYDITIKTYWLK
ncbi:hypothetical protein EBR66_00760 [bacterium]|nr:hypothetical protein [bacterium]